MSAVHVSTQRRKVHCHPPLRAILSLASMHHASAAHRCGQGGGGYGETSPNDCCSTSVFPGCSDAVCCEKVCAVDPSCCDQYWDMDCVNAAKAMCEACGASPPTGDATGDGAVDGSGLAAVLVAWGSSGRGELDADLNDDGTVDGSDLATILGSWGGCP